MFLGIILINYFVNPFGVFKTKGIATDDIASYQRYFIYPKLKINKNEPIDYAVFGSSNTNSYFSEQQLSEIFNKKFRLFCIDAGQYEEFFNILQIYTKLYPNNQKIIFSLDYDAIRDNEKNRLPKYTSDFLNFSEFSFLLFSKAAISYSFRAIKNYLKYLIQSDFGKKTNSACSFRIRHAKLRYINHWETAHVEKRNTKYIEKIKELTEQNHFYIIFYTSPLHSYTLADIYLSGAYKDLEKFKREIVKITPFYDFLYVNKYNKDPISLSDPYWTNSLHGDTMLGKIIMKKITEREGDFGIFVTQKNIDRVLKQEKADLEKYINTHKKEIDEFRLHPEMDMTPVFGNICAE